MDYQIVEKDNLADLTSTVNEYIHLGWKPLGGVMAVRERLSGPLVYLQAVLQNGSEPGTTKYGRGPGRGTGKRGRPRKIKNVTDMPLESFKNR